MDDLSSMLSEREWLERWAVDSLAEGSVRLLPALVSVRLRAIERAPVALSAASRSRIGPVTLGGTRESPVSACSFTDDRSVYLTLDAIGVGNIPWCPMYS